MITQDKVLGNIEFELQGLADFDQLQIHIQKHAGGYGKTEIVKVAQTRIDGEEPNVTATSMIFQLIKAMQEAGESGQLTFSLKFTNGYVRLVSVQDFKELK